MPPQRRRGAKKRKAERQQAACVTPAPVANDHVGSKVTLRGLLAVTLTVASPYVAWISYLWVHLQSGFLRPAVPDTGLRQVLIVGTQSSGTSQVAADLRSVGLEVQHEYSDTQWSFSRDGTVSWFHGLRFLEGSPGADSVSGICGELYRNIGFHPAMIRSPRRGCSYRNMWGPCWQQECASIVRSEWGCALRPAGCETPYARHLLQVRRPIRTIESLVAKFCLDGTGGEARAHRAIITLTVAMFPDLGGILTSDSCLPAVSWYVVRYLETMLAALEAGAIHDSYHVEDINPCGLARLAGFLDIATAVYPESAAAAARACADGTTNTDQTLRRNRRNKGRVRLNHTTFENNSKVLALRLRALSSKLGYSVGSAESDEAELHHE